MRRWVKGTIAVVAVVTAATGGLFAAIGWFGGPIYTDIAAQGAPSPADSQVAAVVLSGDMGFHIGMAAKVAGALARHGIPTVGVNTLTYFRKPRTPEDATRLVEKSIERALRFGHRERVVLVGESFGADILHVGLAGLAPELREKVGLVALVVPGETVQLQATPSEVLPVKTPERDALPTARRLDWVDTICIQGEQEPHSLCPELDLPNVTRIALPGGHLLRNDAQALGAALLGAITASQRKVHA